MMFKTDAVLPNTALVYCDSNLWMVKFDGHSYTDPPLHRIWFTDVDNVSDAFPFSIPI